MALKSNRAALRALQAIINQCPSLNLLLLLLLSGKDSVATVVVHRNSERDGTGRSSRCIVGVAESAVSIGIYNI